MLSRHVLFGHDLAAPSTVVDASREGNRVTLTIAGTSPAEGSVLAESLALGLGERADVRIVDDARSLDTLPAETRCVLLVESPTMALARWLASAADSGGATNTLRIWNDSASRVLRRVQRSPASSLVIDAEEALTDLPALVRTVTQWCGLPLPSEDLAIGSAPARDALGQALATQLCRLEPASVRLFDELHACSAVLLRGSPATGAPTATDLGAAIDRYRELMAHERELGRGQQQVAALETTLQAARDALAAQVAEAGAARGARARAETAAASHSADAETLLSRVVELHAMLEDEHLRGEQHARAAAERTSESNSLRQQLAQHVAQISLLQTARADAESVVARLRKEGAALETQRATLQHRVLEQEKAVRALELEGANLQVAAAWYGGLPGPAVFRTAGLRLLETQDKPPHRHLHFALAALEIDGLSAPPAEIRLLDHLGQPGLAVFAQGQQTFLSAWEPHGREGEQTFMLFVPSDGPGQAALQRLGTTDWSRLRHVVVILAQHLQSAGAPPGWADTAQRLVRRLQGLPVRLRYDGVRIEGSGRGVRSIDIVFEKCSYADRYLADIRLRWEADGGKLLWQRHHGVPLTCWPAKSGGTIDELFELPVGRSDRVGWRAIPPSDQELLLALLDALPGAVAKAPAQALPDGLSPHTLAAAATQLHKQARRAQHASLLREMLRRVLRRVPRSQRGNEGASAQG